METLDLLRLIVARDASRPPPISAWDATAWQAVHGALAAWDARSFAYAAVRAARLADDVPPPILEAWRAAHAASTAVSLQLTFEADALVAALAPLGARAVPLKGTALFTLGVHRDPGARPTCDVDLLIAPDAAPAARRLLAARGYDATRAGGPKHWPPFVRDGLVVEVHEHAFWSLADGHRVGLGEMVDARWRPALGPAVAHLLHHLFESSVTVPWLVVKTLADLNEVRAFAEPRPDVAGEVADAARRFGLGRRLGALAGLLARALDRPVPEEWTREQRPADVDALLRRCAPVPRPFEEALRLPDRAAAFARMPLSEKAALARHHLAPPPDALRGLYGLPAGSPWVWPLYAARPAHLLGRSVLDAARLAIRAGATAARRARSRR